MKTMQFRIKSPENYTRLLATILFEKSEFFKEFGYLWHEVFNTDDDTGDGLFLQFMTELFPQGANIAETELKSIMLRAVKHLQTNRECQDLHNSHLKQQHRFWVYSKWDNRLIPCRMAEHARVVKECCIEFYGDMEELDIDKVRQFILSNFEISSDNSTVQSISKDARFITLEIDRRQRIRRGEEY